MHRSLNLTAATHVHLVEPQWNPMLEAQAAGRVDRLDQDKGIVILRYIVKDSIEEVFQYQLPVHSAANESSQIIKTRQRRKLLLARLSTSCATAESDIDTVDAFKR